jgi:hypothetical protein
MNNTQIAKALDNLYDFVENRTNCINHNEMAEIQVQIWGLMEK